MSPCRLKFALCWLAIVASGCRSGALWRSTYTPDPSAVGVVAVPESRYWENPEPISPGATASADKLTRLPGDNAYDANIRRWTSNDQSNDVGQSLYDPAVRPAADFERENGDGNAEPSSDDLVEPASLPRSFAERLHDDFSGLWPTLLCEEKHYYSLENLERMTVGVGIAAILANTQADVRIHRWYQHEVRSDISDDISAQFKKLGNGGYTIPAMAAGWIVGDWFGDYPAGGYLADWGQRSVAGLVVGAPPMFVMQYVTGGSRPGEIREASDWKPFHDNNGVSGHAFIGALPFMTAAKMTDEWEWKLGFYTCASFAGLSRINDDAHFTSQVILGWWMAYCAVTAVDEGHQQTGNWHVGALPMENGNGLAITYQY
jgi:hypothetical protein